ncbi:MAG: class I SAM-dependent methyltransferase [Deltaproteobacteria bacterium]|nr:class I SAM-dependent methyltransferase [Deltaproteobacteria bacterium]
MRVDLDRLLATGEIEGARGRLEHRLHSMRKAVELLDQSPPKVMVETGCQWSDLLHAHGMSTCILGALAEKHDAILYTIDISMEHIEICRAYSEEYSEYIRYIHGDSLEVLEDFDQEIDFLYLDSFDFSPGFEETSRLHQLNEITSAYPKLSSQSAVLLDDAYVRFHYTSSDVDVQGKTYYSHKFLMKNNAQCIVDIPHYQRLYRITK